MRALTIAITTGLIAAACGGAAQPAATTAPTATPTTAPTVAATPAPTPTPVTAVKFTADLKTENEVPPISNDEKVASGKATVTFALTRDSAGKITAAKASIDATFTGFPATAAITIGHIHNAAAGANGGVVVPWKTDADSPLTLTAGATTFKKADVTVDPDLAQKIIDTPANFYVNFHTKLNPGGVVRGQLVKG